MRSIEPMKVMSSDFIVRGYKNGNTYYIVKNIHGRFDVYQLQCDVNAMIPLSGIRQVFPEFNELPDRDIIVQVPDEVYNAFLLLHDVSMIKMNLFRLSLEDEEIL